MFDAHGAEIAAAIIEPLPANYGLLPQREAWLQRLAERCRRAGALLIFDEVISGFRIGKTGMAGPLGIRPDLVTYGKVIGGGFPVGAYAGRKELMERVAPAGSVYQAGTLSANPIGMRAGLASLTKVDADGRLGDARRAHAAFCEQLVEASRRSPSRSMWCARDRSSGSCARPSAPVRRPDRIPAGNSRMVRAVLPCGDRARRVSAAVVVRSRVRVARAR